MTDEVTAQKPLSRAERQAAARDTARGFDGTDDGIVRERTPGQPRNAGKRQGHVRLPIIKRQ